MFQMTFFEPLNSGVQRGGKRGDGPGHPRQGGFQRVKSQILKFCATG